MYEINWGIIGRDPETPPQIRPSWVEAKKVLTEEINAYAQDWLPFDEVDQANQFLRNLSVLESPKDLTFTVGGHVWWVVQTDWIKEIPDFPMGDQA